jgi:hypothetical protein
MEDNNNNNNKLYFFDDLEEEMTVEDVLAEYEQKEEKKKNYKRPHVGKRKQRTISKSPMKYTKLRERMIEKNIINSSVKYSEFKLALNSIGEYLMDLLMEGHVVELPRRTGHLFIGGYKVKSMTDHFVEGETDDYKHGNTTIQYAVRWVTFGVMNPTKYAYVFSIGEKAKKRLKEAVKKGQRYPIRTGRSVIQYIRKIKKNKFLE